MREMPITLERIPHEKQVAVKTFLMLGHSYRKIAKALDISTGTITTINRQSPANIDEVEQFKKRLIAESYSLTARAWNRVTDDKLEHMNALQLTTIGAIGIDKARDMEGSNRPVFNVVTVINECKQTREKLERELMSAQSIRGEIDASPSRNR